MNHTLLTQITKDQLMDTMHSQLKLILNIII